MEKYHAVAADMVERAVTANETDDATHAVSAGLVAIAYALLDVADKMDDIRRELTLLREARQAG